MTVVLVGAHVGSVSTPVALAVIVIVFFVGKHGPSIVCLFVTVVVAVARGQSVTVPAVTGGQAAAVVSQAVVAVGQRVYGTVVDGSGEQSYMIVAVREIVMTLFVQVVVMLGKGTSVQLLTRGVVMKEVMVVAGGEQGATQVL